MDFSIFYPPTVFVHIALIFYVAGFLVRDGVLLRSLVLSGSIFYVLYYYFISNDPLWDAIFASCMIGLANIYGIVYLTLERSTVGMSASSKETYSLLPTLNPGQFKKVMKLSREITTTTDTVLCHQGVSPTGLFLIKSGSVLIERGGKQAEVKQGNFIGELSFLLDQGASATVTAPAGTTYLEWESGDLRKMMLKSPPLSNALVALFNQDIARKLVIGWPEDLT